MKISFPLKLRFSQKPGPIGFSLLSLLDNPSLFSHVRIRGGSLSTVRADTVNEAYYPQKLRFF